MTNASSLLQLLLTKPLCCRTSMWRAALSKRLRCSCQAPTGSSTKAALSLSTRCWRGAGFFLCFFLLFFYYSLNHLLTLPAFSQPRRTRPPAPLPRALPRACGRACHACARGCAHARARCAAKKKKGGGGGGGGGGGLRPARAGAAAEYRRHSRERRPDFTAVQATHKLQAPLNLPVAN